MQVIAVEQAHGKGDVGSSAHRFRTIELERMLESSVLATDSGICWPALFVESQKSNVDWTAPFDLLHSDYNQGHPDELHTCAMRTSTY